MQTVKYKGLLNLLEQTYIIRESGTLYTDELFDGINVTKVWLHIIPIDDEVSVSIYKTNKDKSAKILVEQHKLTQDGYIFLDGLAPYIVEIQNSCKVIVKTYRV